MPRHQTRLFLLACGLILSGCQKEAQLVTDSDPAYASYRLGADSVALVDGIADVPAAPASSSRIRTQILGEPAVADLDGDGNDDAVVVLTQQTGGTGTFFYLAAAVATPQGLAGTQGVLLGDRIALDSVSVLDGRITVRYRTRAANQSFAEAPAIERIRDFVLAGDEQSLTEVARDFEGEADAGRMSLTMKTWVWIRTRYNDDTVKQPQEPGAFTLTFSPEGMQGTTDCNSFRSEFAVQDQQISFERTLAATRSFCARSQEAEFLEMLSQVQSYLFTSQGQLILELRYDSGAMEFR
jgi:heat shock protein HslJ